jgi:hypothetical protein
MDSVFISKNFRQDLQDDMDFLFKNNLRILLGFGLLELTGLTAQLTRLIPAGRIHHIYHLARPADVGGQVGPDNIQRPIEILG